MLTEIEKEEGGFGYNDCVDNDRIAIDPSSVSDMEEINYEHDPSMVDVKGTRLHMESGQTYKVVEHFEDVVAEVARNR